MEDAAHDLAVFEHVVVVVAPTRWVAALEDERGHHGGGGGGGGFGGLGGGGFGLTSIMAILCAGAHHQTGRGFRGQTEVVEAVALLLREWEKVRGCDLLRDRVS